MLSLSNCLLKPEIAIGLYGNTNYINDIHVSFQVLLSSKINLIPIDIDNNTLPSSSLVPLFRNSKVKIENGPKGLLAHNFIKRLQMSPCVIIIPLDISKQPLQGRTETKIYEDYCELIKSIKSSYINIGIIPLIIISNNTYSSDQISSLIKSSSFNGLIDKRNVVFIQSKEFENEGVFTAKINKTDLLKFITDFYRNKKTRYEEKRKSCLQLPKRKEIKLLIKLGIISMFNQLDKDIGNYFIEAYDAIITNHNFLNTNINSDSNNDRLIIYCEYRTIADWVLVNMIHYQTLNDNTKRDIILKHISLFDYFTFFNIEYKNKNDYNLNMIAMSYYWTITVYDYFNSNLNEYLESDHMLSFKLIYMVNRLIDFMSIHKEALMTLPSDIDKSKITREDSEYIEQFPLYFINENNTKARCNSDTEIKLIYKHSIEHSILNITKLGIYLQKIINRQLDLDKKWEKCSTNLKMILLLTESIDDKEKKSLYQFFIQKESIKSFPLVYMTILQKYNMYLHKQSMINNNQIITNYLKLSELRQLSIEECGLFQQSLINQINTKQPSIYQMSPNNCLIQPTYSFSDYKPSICDVITFTLSLYLNIDDSVSIYVKRILLQFNQVNRTKKITYEEGNYPSLNKSNPLIISFNLLIQASDSNLFLTMIQLETSTEIIFLISLSQAIDKSLKDIDERNIKDHINIIVPAEFIAGVNEYHDYSFYFAMNNKLLTIDEIDSAFSLSCYNNGKLPLNEFTYISQYDSENKRTTSKDRLNVRMKAKNDKGEFNEISKIDFLLKIMSKSYEDYFIMDYDIKIKISHINCIKDHFLYEKKEHILIEVKDPFEFIHDYSSLYYYINQENDVVFPIGQMIKDTMTIHNLLRDPIVFQSITITPSDDIEVYMINDLKKRLKQPLMPCSEYIIPVSFVSKKEREEFLQGVLLWYTKDLIDYAPNILNTTSFYLPIMDIKQFGISVKSIYTENDGLYHITLNNNDHMPLIFSFAFVNEDVSDNENNYIVIGKTIFKSLVMPDSHIDFDFYIIQIHNKHNELNPIRLPRIKLSVYNVGKTNSNDVLCIIYYENNNNSNSI